MSRKAACNLRDYDVRNRSEGGEDTKPGFDRDRRKG